jgi:hypothetical protein
MPIEYEISTTRKVWLASGVPNPAHTSLRAWETACPPVFQKFDKSKCENFKAFERAMALPNADWDEHGCELDERPPHGVLFYGPTGSGKTRAMWQWARELMIENRFRSVFMTDGLGWKTVCWKSAMNVDAQDDFIQSLTLDERIDDLPVFELVLIDDVDKATLTASAANALLALIERRSASGLWIGLTTQLTGAKLQAKIIRDMGADKDGDLDGRTATATSIIRRLKDPSLFQAVNFGR